MSYALQRQRHHTSRTWPFLGPRFAAFLLYCSGYPVPPQIGLYAVHR